VKYRKKPVVIEAIQFTEETMPRLLEWMSQVNGTFEAEFGKPPTLTIQTWEGPMTARWGDWIIKGVKGEFYPCHKDVFDLTYEAVVE